ncbi:MAG: SURF1 family protein [Aquabacterium sp.]
MTPLLRQLALWTLAITLMVVTTSAGFWQLRRAEEKTSALAAMQVRQEARPWGNADWPCEVAIGAAIGAAHDTSKKLPAQQPVVLRGHWLAGNTVFLDNRPMDQGSGFIVVTPLVLTPEQSGHCRGHIVLVQRGWVPRDQQDRTHLPDLLTPDAEVEVTGRVVVALSQVYQLGQEAEPPPHQTGHIVRQNADAAFWTTWLGQAPLVGAVLQVQAAQPADAPELVRHWAEPGFGADRHKAYALQWFVMSAVLAGLTIWFQIISPRRQRDT